VTILPRPFTGHEATLRSRTGLVADAIVLVAVAVMFWLLLRLAHGVNEPFNRVSAPSSVSTDPANLPYHAFRSLARMFAALLCLAR
jgi:NitT/TauT family transport system permease protein